MLLDFGGGARVRARNPFLPSPPCLPASLPSHATSYVPKESAQEQQATAATTAARDTAGNRMGLCVGDVWGVGGGISHVDARQIVYCCSGRQPKASSTRRWQITARLEVGMARGVRRAGESACVVLFVCCGVVG